METNILLLPSAEAQLRRNKVASLLREQNIDAMLVASNTNLFYLTGRVIAGYVLVTSRGEALYFVRRPVGLTGDGVQYIRKPEQIPATLADLGIALNTIALELDTLSYSSIVRLSKAFEGSEMANASPLLSQARAIKTPYEINQIRLSGVQHDRVYSRIPGLYNPGMTDYELQIEIEHMMRMEGCLGQLRVSGESMEIHMGNLTVGDNADNPSPYDFTMGGAGMSPSMPVGASGELIKTGQTVMADMNGNFNGYMTDMSRTFAVGAIPELARKAHQCSIDICHTLADMGKPGVEVKSLYAKAEEMVTEAGLEAYFMGHAQHASFIGHGVGIEINELPVVTARSRDRLAVGNVIALEPKFVIPHVGAVGIENTYVVTPDGMSSLNHATEEIIEL